MKYSDIAKNNVKFVTIAEYGATGRAGCIELLALADNKLIYYLGNENIYNSPKIMDMDEFYQVFSEFKKTRPSITGNECDDLPDKWEYVHLGMGNHLFVSSEVYDYFKALVDYLPNESHPYQIWMTCALLTLILLDEGFTDKEKFLEKAKKISLEQNSDKMPIIKTWNRYIHCSHKYNKDFKKISLDKIDNPKYIESNKQKPSIKSKVISFLIYMIIMILIYALCMAYVIFIK